MSEHNHLFSEMPVEERKRLMPYMIETQILHLQQARSMIVAAHKAELRKLDDWIANCKRHLKKEEAASGEAGR